MIEVNPAWKKWNNDLMRFFDASSYMWSHVLVRDVGKPIYLGDYVGRNDEVAAEDFEGVAIRIADSDIFVLDAEEATAFAKTISELAGARKK